MANPQATPTESAAILEAAMKNPVMIAVYRGQSQEVINFVNKKTGLAESFQKHSLALENVDGQQMTGEVQYPKGAPAVPVTYQKDQRLFLTLSGMIVANGATTIRVTSHRPL